MAAKGLLSWPHPAYDRRRVCPELWQPGKDRRIERTYKYDADLGLLIVDEYVIDLAVFDAMVKGDPTVLWRFQRHRGRILAVPYSEKEVIWIDKEQSKPAIFVGAKTK